MRVKFTAEAQAELEEATRWYLERAGERVHDRLREELKRVRRLLLDHPAIGSPGVADTRKIRLDQFPYSVVYRINGGELRVLAFMHHRCRPGYWRGRR